MADAAPPEPRTRARSQPVSAGAWPRRLAMPQTTEAPPLLLLLMLLLLLLLLLRAEAGRAERRRSRPLATCSPAPLPSLSDPEASEYGEAAAAPARPPRAVPHRSAAADAGRRRPEARCCAVPLIMLRPPPPLRATEAEAGRCRCRCRCREGCWRCFAAAAAAAAAPLLAEPGRCRYCGRTCTMSVPHRSSSLAPCASE